MPIASYKKEWEGIKANFERATNKKKPSEKLLGIFNKSSGIEKAAGAFDAALKKKEPKAITTTFEALQTAATAYQNTLAKAAAAEKNKDVQAETKVMLLELTNLLDEAEDAEDEATPKLKSCGTIGGFSKLMKNKDKGKQVHDYAKKVYSTEIVGFLEAMVKKDHSPKTYKTFVKDNDVNISGSLHEKFNEDDLDSAPWDEATKEVLKQFNDNIIVAINREK